MIKGLDFGMGTDIWNVSIAEHKHFTTVTPRDDSVRGLK